MALIIDPDDLVVGNVVFDPVEKTIELVKDVAGSLLSDDGITLQCLYSYCKEEWKENSTLIKYPFPYIAITAEQFELVEGWNHASGYTNDLIRDGGWALKASDGSSLEEYMNLTTLGTFNDPEVDRAYYQQYPNGGGTDAVFTGSMNQAVKIFGAVGYGNFDYRTYFKIYLREQGKTFDFYDLIADQNLTQLTYRKYALPLSNSLDLKITTSDINIETTTPYTNMSITYYDVPEQRIIGTGTYDFSIIINGALGTAEQIYEFVQWSLREQDEINSTPPPSVSGYTSEELLEFVGDTLKTKYTTSGGVYIDNFLATDTNRLIFTDDINVERSYPFVASGNILFNDNLVNDISARYWVFFTDANGNLFDSANAIIINDNNGNPISGLVDGVTSKSFSFDYDGNTQGGRTAGQDASYTAVAIGLTTGQYVKTTGTISRSTANVISYVAALERNYSNPV